MSRWQITDENFPTRLGDVHPNVTRLVFDRDRDPISQCDGVVIIGDCRQAQRGDCHHR